MSAADALRAASMAGVGVRIDGDDLALEADAPPPAEILELLVRHKREIVALLRPDRGGWSAEDWQVYFDERAGVAEFDGGLRRSKAENRAFECCVAKWLNRNFEPSPPGCCHACGGGDNAHDILLPHGVEPIGHVWLHSRCWPTWHARRKAEAVAALNAMGITQMHTPNTWPCSARWHSVHRQDDRAREQRAGAADVAIVQQEHRE